MQKFNFLLFTFIKNVFHQNYSMHLIYLFRFLSIVYLCALFVSVSLYLPFLLNISVLFSFLFASLIFAMVSANRSLCLCNSLSLSLSVSFCFQTTLACYSTEYYTHIKRFIEQAARINLIKILQSFLLPRSFLSKLYSSETVQLKFIFVKVYDTNPRFIWSFRIFFKQVANFLSTHDGLMDCIHRYLNMNLRNIDMGHRHKT